MIEFSYPWLFLLLPLPWFVQRFAPAYKIKQTAVQVPFFQQLVRLSGEQPNQGAVKLQPQIWHPSRMQPLGQRAECFRVGQRPGGTNVRAPTSTAIAPTTI